MFLNNLMTTFIKLRLLNLLVLTLTYCILEHVYCSEIMINRKPNNCQTLFTIHVFNVQKHSQIFCVVLYYWITSLLAYQFRSFFFSFIKKKYCLWSTCNYHQEVKLCLLYCKLNVYKVSRIEDRWALFSKLQETRYQ